jgi:hypothetical protein
MERKFSIIKKKRILVKFILTKMCICVIILPYITHPLVDFHPDTPILGFGARLGSAG